MNDLTITNWDRFLDSFFNLRVAAEYLPKIIEGFWLTIILAACIIVSGLAAGLGLAVVRSLGIRPLNWLIIFVVDLFRALPPLVIIVLLYFGLPAAGYSLSWLRRGLAVPRPGADGLRRGDLLGRHHRRAEGPVGGGALHRPRLPADPGHGGAAAGAADDHPAADQPHHRHHQGHGARQRGRGARDPGRGAGRRSSFSSTRHR